MSLLADPPTTPAPAPADAGIHASCVALDGRGVLLRGGSGAGKSDLALRLIDRGGTLVADDRVCLAAGRGRLIARAPEALFGRLEARGLGLLALPALTEATLALVVDLVAPERVQRHPDPAWTTLHGIALPLLALDPFAASTPAKIALALTHRC